MSSRGLIRIYSRTVCVLLRRSNLMGALLISWTTVVQMMLLQSSISILDVFCKPLVTALEPDINYFRRIFSHWTKTSNFETCSEYFPNYIHSESNVKILRHFLLIIAAKKCQGFFRHSRGRDYDPPRLSSRLRKKEGEIASDDDDDAWVVAHGAEWGSRRSPSY